MRMMYALRSWTSHQGPKAILLSYVKMREALGADGTNVIINNSPASGQEVPHLHIHVIPRYKDDGISFFPPSMKYEDGEASEYGRKLAL